MNNKQHNLKLFSGALFAVFLLTFIFSVRSFASYDLWDSYTVPSTRQKPRLLDNADLLSDSEEQEILFLLDQTSQKWGCNLVLLTVDDHNGDIQSFADDYFDYNGFGADYNGSGILFMLSMYDREYAFSTRGEAIRAFTDYGLDYLIDEMSGDFRDNDYYSAFKTYVSSCDSLLYQYSQGSAYDVNSKKIRTDSDYVRFGIYSILIGLGVALIPILKMKSDLHTVKMNSGATGYSKQGIRVLTSQDLFLHKTVSKTPIPRNDSSKGSFGGSSTHTSSSGSTHGGSSGHF